MFDYKEVIDEAGQKNTLINRIAAILGYYTVAVVTYPYFLLKNLLEK